MLESQEKKDWLEALRSGEYQQGIDYLCVNNRFCCIGLFEKLRDNLEFKDSVARTKDELHSIAGSIYLREKVGQRFYGHLIKMNDALRNNFNEIADWIEVNL